MDLTGQGLQVQNTGVISTQEYLRQKEELRRLKAMIEAAERSMDFQLAGQMQPMIAAVPQHAVAQAPFVYPPGSLPALSLSISPPSSPVTQDTAHIVEVDNHLSSQNQTSTVPTSNIIDGTTPFHQGYIQPGLTNFVQPGPSNKFSQGPLDARNSQQPLSSTSYTHERPVQSSSHISNLPFRNMHSQVAFYGTPYQQNQQNPAQMRRSHPTQPGTTGFGWSPYQQSSNPNPTLQSGSSVPARRYGGQEQVYSQSGNQLQASAVQRTLPNGEAPVGYPLSYVSFSSMQSADLPRPQRPMQNGNVYSPHYRNLGSRMLPPVTQGSRGVTAAAGQSTSMGVTPPNLRTLIPISHTMSPGPRSGNNQRSVPPESHGASQHGASAGGTKVASTPAQRHPNSNHTAPIHSSSPNLFAQSSIPRTTPSTVPVDQANVHAGKSSQLPALSTLTELLAGHEQWSEEASSRILKQTMGFQNVPENVQGEVVVNPPATHLNDSEGTQARNVSQVSAPSSENQPLRPPTPVRHLSLTHENVVSPGSIASPSLPCTPVGGNKSVGSTPRSANADRKTLAKDILRALGPPSTKRKRDRLDVHEGSGGLASSPSAKRNKISISDVPRGSELLINGDTPVNGSKGPEAPPTTTPSNLSLAQQHLGPTQVANSLAATSERPYPALSPQQQQRDGTQTSGAQSWKFVPPTEHLPNGYWYLPSDGAPIRWPPISQTWNSATHPPVSPPWWGEPQRPPQTSNSQVALSKSDPHVKRPSAKKPVPVSKPRPPLFLPSSESPPASPYVTPLQTPNHAPKGVGLGIALPKSKPIVEISSPRTIKKFTAPSPVIPDAGVSGQLFGRPTGVLAQASTSIPRVGVRLPRSRPFVLVPQVDKGPWRASARMHSRSAKGKEKAINSLSEYCEAADIVHDDDEADKDRVSDFARRLIKRSCLWKNCQAILDSGEKLMKHVKVVHGKDSENMLYVCRWKECQSTRAFSDSERLIHHLQWHVSSRIYCGFKSCGFQTQVAVQLRLHVAEYHAGRSNLRPLAVPVDLMSPGLPEAIELTLPTYMSVPIPVSPRQISQERHQKLGPWVLQYIFGRVAIKKGAVSASVPLRSQRLLERQEYSAPRDGAYQQVQQKFSPQDDYEFLKKEGATKSFASLALLPLNIEDLEITEETALGLDNGEPSVRDTSVDMDVVGASDIQDPARSEAATQDAEAATQAVEAATTRDASEPEHRGLAPGTAESIRAEPKGGVLSLGREAAEVEGLL